MQKLNEQRKEAKVLQGENIRFRKEKCSTDALLQRN